MRARLADLARGPRRRVCPCYRWNGSRAVDGRNVVGVRFGCLLGNDSPRHEVSNDIGNLGRLIEVNRVPRVVDHDEFAVRD